MTFTDALARRGIQFRQSGTKVHFNCVFCTQRGKSDTKKRLCVDIKAGWGRCVSCDWKHRYAIKPVLRELGVTYEVSGSDPPEQRKIEATALPEDFQLLTKTFDELDEKAKQYLLGRGVTERQISKHRIGVSYTGRYAYRIIFPIYLNGKLNGFNARDFTGKRKPKYLLSPGIKSFFNFNPKRETVVFSEGVIKALRIAQVTKHNSASLLGHDLTELQLDQLRNSVCKHVIVYPDPDSVGMNGAVKVADKLIDNWSGKVSIVWPVTQPADEAPLQELRNLLQSYTRFTGLTRPKFRL